MFALSSLLLTLTLLHYFAQGLQEMEVASLHQVSHLTIQQSDSIIYKLWGKSDENLIQKEKAGQLLALQSVLLEPQHWMNLLIHRPLLMILKCYITKR